MGEEKSLENLCTQNVMSFSLGDGFKGSFLSLVLSGSPCLLHRAPFVISKSIFQKRGLSEGSFRGCQEVGKGA